MSIAFDFHCDDEQPADAVARPLHAPVSEPTQCESKSSTPQDKTVLFVNLLGTSICIACCLATVAFSGWMAIDGFRTFMDQVTALSTNDLLNGIAGR